MNPLSEMLAPYKWAVVALALAALVAGYFSWETHIRNDERSKVVAKYNKQIDTQKADAQKKLLEVTAQVDSKTKELQDHKDQQENTDDVNEKTITILADKLRATRLRDPGAVAGCGQSGSSTTSQNPSNASSSPTNPTTGTGILSQQLTDYLVGQAKLADEINNAYMSCRSIMAQVTGG